MENNRGDMVDSERIWYYWSKKKILSGNIFNPQFYYPPTFESTMNRNVSLPRKSKRTWKRSRLERERKNSGRRQGEGERKTFIPKDRITGQQLVFGKFGRGRVWKLFARQRGRRRSSRGNEFASRSRGGSREDRLTRKRSGSTLPLAGENGNEPFIR